MQGDSTLEESRAARAAGNFGNIAKIAVTVIVAGRVGVDYLEELDVVV